MEQRKKSELKGTEKDKIKFDFVKPELDYIIENANFTEIQENVFKRLTDKRGRQSIVQISLGENISERTTSRIIKQIKNKIMKIL